MFLPAAIFAHAVGIYAPGADASQVDAAVEGCNQALGDERCAPARSETNTEWVATITWSDAEYRLAHVLLVRPGQEPAEEVTRDVEFGPEDPLEQRFRAVGLIVAAYVIASGHATPEQPEPLPSEPPEPPLGAPPKALAPPKAPEPRRRGKWGLDGAALMGGDLARERIGLGGMLRPWWRPPQLPLFALMQGRWMRSGNRLQAEWVSSSLGLGAHLQPRGARLGIELRIEGVAQHVSLLASDARTQRVERAEAWRFGARGGVDFVVDVAESWALFVGGDASALRPRLVVDVAGEAVGRERPVLWEGLAGIRFRQE